MKCPEHEQEQPLNQITSAIGCRQKLPEELRFNKNKNKNFIYRKFWFNHYLD